MLDNETKRRIDNARDILVGKVPDPKSQVEQITIALIYKFMDDMDKDSKELGGNASFFSGEFEKYSWSSIFDPKLGGHDLIALYSKALEQINLNPNIPELFRNIFKNAYLPYRDPETLKSFLKIINDFNYEHSEKLGDAFEYLLSVLGSQGDAGQFRTPRHIIDFVVEVLEPKKNETILDPACGTAGFLISSFKHILKNNTNERSGDLLTPDEREQLSNNFVGYDISPDMVRLSLVNLYLHGFSSPKVFEYDTLSSEERWNETFDVIIANPPFMSPKGGIKPHKKFSIQANRSEVLFIDYIAEHLSVNGRAGIIVPEGIIFQSGNAYKSLRKMLVENYLYAVVSLPAGIFNPYSGVKTSILLMDSNLSKKTDNILFVKVSNDGFDLGAQRKSIVKNDLSQALEILKEYKLNLNLSERQEHNISDISLIVPKSKLAEKGDYNLSMDRYKENEQFKNSKYDLGRLGDVCYFKRGPFGGSLKKEIFVKEGYKIYEQKNAIKNNFEIGEYFISEEKFNEMKSFELMPNDLIISCSGTMGKIAIAPLNIRKGIINQALLKLTPNNKMSVSFLKYILSDDNIQKTYFNDTSGAAIQNVASVKDLKEIKIPLPPLETQKQIVEEIETYQKNIQDHKLKILELEQKIKDTISEVWGNA